MKLNLNKRSAEIGGSINTRTERHGEELVPGVDIPVTGLMLDKEELNILLEDEFAHDCLFTDARGKQLEPRFLNVAPIVVLGKFEEASVTISLQGEDGLLLKPAKISKIILEPQVGGLTLVSCTIQANPPDHFDVCSYLNQKCRLAIRNAEREPKPNSEPELPLEHQEQSQSDEAPGAAAEPTSGGKRGANPKRPGNK